MYDCTFGALVPIGRALTNTKPTELDTEYRMNELSTSRSSSYYVSAGQKCDRTNKQAINQEFWHYDDRCPAGSGRDNLSIFGQLVEKYLSLVWCEDILVLIRKKNYICLVIWPKLFQFCLVWGCCKLIRKMNYECLVI